MATRRRTRKEFKLKSGPWSGCFESWDPAPETDDKLFAATNCVFRNAQGRLAVQARPGFAKQTQLGAGANRTPQCVYQHTQGSTDYAFVFAGGKMYRWLGGVFTDITPGTVTISTTARIFCTTFANKLIVSDGVNRPWTYDHATTTATYIQFNTAAQAWCAYGPPVIYGAKLFFILNTVNSIARRTEIAWSEEGDAATGYFQDNFDNVWELTQTDADPLFCLWATNTALYYFRGDSIGAVQGIVNEDFRTSAVQDSVSLTVGTTNPGSVTQAGNFIWWVDRLGHVHRLPVGGQVEDVWLQLQPTSDAAPALSGAMALERWSHIAFVQELGVVACLIWSSGASQPSGTLYMFDAVTGAYTGTWANSVPIYYISAMGCLRDVNQREIFVLLAASQTFGAAGDGWAFTQNLLQSGGVSYYKDDTTQMTASVQTRQLNDDASEEWIFDRIDVEYAGDDAGRVAFVSTISYSTSRESPTSQSVTVPASNIGTQRGTVGIVGRGRYISVTSSIVTTTTTAVPAGFNRIEVVAFPDGSDPSMP